MVKTKTWIVLVAALLLLSLSLSLWLLLPRADAAYAEVWSEGKLLYTLPLSVDQQITVTGHHGENVVTVKAGKIAVTAADCPDHYCMERGYCAGGTQIVCLPNRLVIRFVGEQKLDGIAG